MPGGTFHLTARLHSGVPRLTPDLRTEVVELLAQEVTVSDAALFAYVVMPNHLHLVVRQGAAELSELMQPLLRRVALAVRRANGVVGHVFERPFRDRYCAGPGHARNSIVYTNLNPFRAGLCSDPGDYPWSSRGEWLVPTGLRSAGGCVAMDLAAPLFATTPGRTAVGLREDYLEFERSRMVRDRLRRESDPTDSAWGPPPPRTTPGNRYWIDVLGPAAARRRPRGERARGTRPRSADLSAIARAAVAEIDPRLSAAVLRSRRGGPPYVRARHAIIRRAAEAGNRLIGDLLDVTRIEADQLMLQFQPVDPAVLVREAVELNASLASDRRITLRAEAGDELPDIRADRDRLLQVLANLIGNAIKFTPRRGTIVVRVACDGEACRFSVADSGPGIPPEELPRLFEAFWQAQRGTVEGTGLGLAIARGIVEGHHGRIWVESTLGSGSTFLFTVPHGEHASPQTGDYHAGEP